MVTYGIRQRFQLLEQIENQAQNDVAINYYIISKLTFQLAPYFTMENKLVLFLFLPEEINKNITQ